MLQQTQVATVIAYYKKWIEKWPTVESLSQASLQDVHAAWSGLGYYSRATRLLEGAQKVVNKMDGRLPSSASALLMEIPGVGRYTAGAVASIAYNEVTGVVDGNVSRVFSRVYALGADITNQAVINHLWELANSLVDDLQPGDFNQALMELGATVCTPRSPDCSGCPISTLCSAHTSVSRAIENTKETLLKRKPRSVCDIEDVSENCFLCFENPNDYDKKLGVANYPRKAKKKTPRQETTAVCVFHKKDLNKGDQFLLVQRPEKGLLAGLWEFPNVTLENEKSDAAAAITKLCEDKLDANSGTAKFMGEVVHLFSHIHQTYKVFSMEVMCPEQLKNSERKIQWCTKEELLADAISTAMKKVFKKYEESFTSNKRKAKEYLKDGKDSKRQLKLSNYFSKA